MDIMYNIRVNIMTVETGHADPTAGYAIVRAQNLEPQHRVRAQIHTTVNLPQKLDSTPPTKKTQKSAFHGVSSAFHGKLTPKTFFTCILSTTNTRYEVVVKKDIPTRGQKPKGMKNKK